MVAEPARNQTAKGACPRGNIIRCPLYIESHVGSGRGCVDDMLRPCMVERGEMNFQEAILELARAGVAHPGIKWYFWKFIHNALIHPWLALPWEPRWAQRAHDWTAKRCKGGG